MRYEKQITDQKMTGLFGQFTTDFPEGDWAMDYVRLAFEYAYNLGRKHERESSTKDAK